MKTIIFSILSIFLMVPVYGDAIRVMGTFETTNTAPFATNEETQRKVITRTTDDRGTDIVIVDIVFSVRSEGLVYYEALDLVTVTNTRTRHMCKHVEYGESVNSPCSLSETRSR